MKYAIHVSDMRTYLTCRRKWDWSSNLRQGLEKKVTYSPFLLGRVVHYALQQYYERDTNMLDALDVAVSREMEAMTDVGDLWPQESEVIKQNVELAAGMLQHYQVWVNNTTGHWTDDNLEFIALETEFSVPLRNLDGRASNRILFEGRFDGIVRRKDNGTIWIWETKTARSIDGLIKTLDNDMQAGAYCLAAQDILGKPVSGVLYNILRKKLPADPRVLQSGWLSKANIDTTAQYYLEAIYKHHADELQALEQSDITVGQWIENNYGDVLTTLLTSEREFFRRQPVRRTQYELEQLQRQIWMIGLEMVRESTPIYPNPAWNTCGFCSFRAPCLAMNSGADFGAILQSEYRSRRQWDPLEATEGETDNNG